MSHPNQLEFIHACAELMKPHYPHGKVIEVGSYAVNGGVRDVFNWVSDYTGIDLANGPGVDVVSSGHEFGISNEYDIAISCEVFEHNPYWLETFVNMIRITKPGGTVLFTCATKGRPEHGTSRSDPGASPGSTSLGWSYYRNLEAKDFMKRIDFTNHFSTYCFFECMNSYDLYFAGTKKSMVDAQSESWLKQGKLVLEQLIASINAQPRTLSPKKHPFFNYLIMLPVYMARKVLSDKHYQNFRYAYLEKKRLLKRRISRRG